MSPGRIRLLAVTVVLAAAIAGCGSSAKRTSSGAPPNTQSTSSPPPAVSDLPAAEHPRAGQFPSAKGKTLQQVANLASSQAQFGAATGTYTPGTRRLAFGLNTSSGTFIYAPTAIYISTTPNAPAQGPFLAPADPMGVAPQNRSQQNAGPGGIQAIYAGNVPVPRAGTYTILALTRVPGGLLGSPGEIAVAQSSQIPDVGQRPPDISTDTASSVAGPALLTTRIPPDDMHAISFNDVLGKRPVVLLFSTPQLCQSRVCGPVTDIAVQLEPRFDRNVIFIHEEVYANNDPKQGLRPQLKAFHLQTEPWLFTVNRQGRIAARLEGAFGINAFTQAIDAALR
jgi:hypothetical protein